MDEYVSEAPLGACRPSPLFKNKGGYALKTVRDKGKHRIWLHHRRVFFLEHGYLPQVVRHMCDNRSCVNIDHLEAGTITSNHRDMMERGRNTRGSSHPGAKLTEEQVLLIRADGGNQRALARKYGVTYQAVFDIVHRRNWKHV